MTQELTVMAGVEAGAPATPCFGRVEGIRDFAGHQRGGSPKGPVDATEVPEGRPLVTVELLEAEAKRIAHALHDETGQLVTLLGLKIAESLRHAPPECAACLRDMTKIVDQLERQIREFSHELRPAMLDDYGIVPTLEFLAQGVAERTGLAIRIVGGAVFEERPPSLVETVLYRTVQEALINVSRHARAKSVTIRFRRTQEALVCAIRDDGRGFEENRTNGPGLGLLGMRQRIESIGGRLHIRSHSGRGVSLKIVLPTGKRHCHAD